MSLSIADTINAVRIGLAIVPEVIGAIKAVETPGNGVDKAAAVAALVRAAFELVPDEVRAKIGVDRILNYADKAVSIVVEFLNKTGQLPKKA